MERDHSEQLTTEKKGYRVTQRIVFLDCIFIMLLGVRNVIWSKDDNSIITDNRRTLKIAEDLITHVIGDI